MMKHLLRSLAILALLLTPSLAQAQAISTPSNAFYMMGSQDNTAATLTGPMTFLCDVDTSGGGGAPGNTSTSGHCNNTQIATFEASVISTLTNKTINGANNTLSAIPATALNLSARLFSNSGTLDISSASITSAMLVSQGAFTAGTFTNATVTVNQQGIITNIAAGGSGPGGGNVNAGTLTLNQLVIGQGTTNIATLGSLGSATTVLHGGTGAPSFSAVVLTTDVSGILPVANLASGTPSTSTILIGAASGSGSWGSITGAMFGTQTINEFLGSPCTGSSATPSFRTLCIQDLPAVPVALNATAPAANLLGGVVDLTGTGTFTVSTSTIPQGDIIVVNNVGSGNWTISGAVTGLNGGASSTTFRPGMNGTIYGNSSGALSYAGTQPPTTTVLGLVLAIDCTTVSANAVVQKINTDGSETCGTTSGSGTVVTTGSPAANGFTYQTGSTSISSTAAATNGQLLIGSTGNPPVAATLTPTSPIGIANTSGTITISCSTCTTNASALTSGAMMTGAGSNASQIDASITASNATLTLGSQSLSTTGLIKLANSGGSGSTTIAGPNPGSNNFTASIPAISANDTFLTAGLVDQTVSGGANLTANNLGTITSGTTTLDCGKNPAQYFTNNSTTSFTLAAPSNDGMCVILMTNNSSGTLVTPTFSGFSVGSNTGDALTITNSSKFQIWISRINGSATYRVAAEQ